MHLTKLYCNSTPVSDLSPLKGMRLTELLCEVSPVSDLSPLEGMNLKRCTFTPQNITKGLDAIRQMKSLTTIGPAWDQQLSPAEFWKKYDAGEFGKPDSTPDRKPITTFNDPAFQQWMKTVVAMPAEQQVDAVAQKLVKLNPGFDGKVTGWDGNGAPKIENGMVTELRFLTDDVTDISPVRALNELQFLYCTGSSQGKRQLSDLSPLRGMKLVKLDCGWSQVADLSPLKEMKLTHLACGGTQVADLSPLEGMPLTSLVCGGTNVSDLSPLRTMPLTNLNFGSTPVSNLLPLKGMHLTDFNCGQTKVSDLSPLKGMPLRNLGCSGTPVSDLSPLQGMRLTGLDCFGTKVSDLSPLHGMPLTKLDCDDTQVANLQPLQGMPLTLLHCPHTPVSDLSPLIGMNLAELCVTPRNITKGIDVIRQMKSLSTIGIDGQNKWPPAEFWKKYDAGEFGKPDSALPRRITSRSLRSTIPTFSNG